MQEVLFLITDILVTLVLIDTDIIPALSQVTCMWGPSAQVSEMKETEITIEHSN